MPKSVDIFSADGLLSQRLQQFRYRVQQQQMSEAIESSLANYSQLIVEAGTGVGKTFSYLIPALLSKKKIIISTGTKHLQDQLYFKDLPTILDILKIPVTTSLLKGRANYLCLYRLEHHAPKMVLHHKRIARKLQIIQEWSNFTKSGEIAEISEINEDDAVWPNVTSTVENCLGAECPSYDKCHVIKARQKAQQADVVVINHHLFFADLALKETGFGELLPDANAFIFDEAHQLPELASAFLSITVTSRQINDLIEDVIAAQVDEAPEASPIRKYADLLRQAILDFQLALVSKVGRKPWHEVMAVAKIEDAYNQCCASLNLLSKELVEISDYGKALEKCVERCERIESDLNKFSNSDDELINWIEIFERGFKLHSTPLEIADSFQAFVERYQCAWIFTSATLTVNGNFDHFQQQLGLHQAQTVMLDSPYDYTNNTRLFLPTVDIEPSHSEYTQTVLNAVIPLLEINHGRTFILFTSHRALQLATEILQEYDEFELLVQGTAPRRELLNQFSITENAVLLGTNSFWEGVDIRGKALSCVVIDKLPFAAPDDPVLVGRLHALKQNGENPFMSYQVPQAVIALKQGVGRLIRDEEDYGVVAICDPRLVTKPYGKFFLSSLPSMPITNSLDDVMKFIEQCETSDEVTCH